MTDGVCRYCSSRRVQRVGVRAGLIYLRCKGCGHFEQELYGEAAELKFMREQEKYFSSISESAIFAEELLSVESTELRKSVLLRVLGPNRSVIEVGPGNGRFLNELSNEGFVVTAVEQSSVLAEALTSTRGLSVVVGEFEKVSLAESAFDALMSFHVIEHVPDPFAHIARAYKVVRTGGYAFLATPNAESLQHKLPGYISPNFDSAHLRVFSRRSLSIVCQDGGWEIVSVLTPDYSSAWLRVLSKILRRLRGEDEERTAGKYATGISTKGQSLIKAFAFLSAPLRALQSATGFGNELFFVLRKTR